MAEILDQEIKQLEPKDHPSFWLGWVSLCLFIVMWVVGFMVEGWDTGEVIAGLIGIISILAAIGGWLSGVIGFVLGHHKKHYYGMMTGFLLNSLVLLLVLGFLMFGFFGG